MRRVNDLFLYCTFHLSFKTISFFVCVCVCEREREKLIFKKLAIYVSIQYLHI